MFDCSSVYRRVCLHKIHEKCGVIKSMTLYGPGAKSIIYILQLVKGGGCKARRAY